LNQSDIGEHVATERAYASPLRIVYVGRISPEKGIRELIHFARFLEAGARTPCAALLLS